MSKANYRFPGFTAKFSFGKDNRSIMKLTKADNFGILNREIYIVLQQAYESCDGCQGKCDDKYSEETDVCDLLYGESPGLLRTCEKAAKKNKETCRNNCWMCYVA